MKILIPYEPPNWNEYIKLERSNKFGANALKQKEKAIVQAYAKGKVYEGNYPVEITFTAHFSDYRRDLDNVRVKGILDGLTACKTLKNDNLKCIAKITILSKVDKKQGIEIDIREHKGNEQ